MEPRAARYRYPALGRLLADRRFVWVVVGLAFLLGLASLDNGLLADDHVHYRLLSAHRAGTSDAPWWDLFVLVEHDPKRTIGMRTAGRYPWWVDPELHIAFFRPLSAATHHLDHRLWPSSGVLMHAHNLGWHAAACAMAWALASKHGAARFGAVATALACVPLAASIPVDRLLVLASFGVALVCAELLDAWLSRRRSLTHMRAAAWVGLLHIGVPGVVGVYVASHIEQVLQLNSLAYGPELPNDGLSKKGLIVLHTPNYPAADNLGLNRALRGLSPPNFSWILHAGPTPPELVCVDARTVELREPSSGWPGAGFSAQFRNIASKPFEVGDTVRTIDYVATVLEVNEGRATAVRFEFRARLDHQSFVWARWAGDEFVLSSPREWCNRLGG